MNRNVKKSLLALLATLALVGTTAASCDTPQSQNSDKMMDARNDKVANITICGNPGESNTCKNLAEHVKRNEDPNRLTYIYLINFQGQPYAYWVAKGPVTPTRAQMAPTDQVLDICPGDGRCWTPMEGPGDDGTSGEGADGLFFYDQNGNEIELYNLSVIMSDGPFDLPGVLELKIKKK